MKKICFVKPFFQTNYSELSHKTLLRRDQQVLSTRFFLRRFFKTSSTITFECFICPCVRPWSLRNSNKTCIAYSWYGSLIIVTDDQICQKKHLLAVFCNWFPDLLISRSSGWVGERDGVRVSQGVARQRLEFRILSRNWVVWWRICNVIWIGCSPGKQRDGRLFSRWLSDSIKGCVPW